MAENIRERKTEKKKTAVMKKAQKEMTRALSSEGLGDVFNQRMLRDFNKQLDDYIHFSNATKQDLSQRVSSRDIAHMLNTQIKGSLKDIGGGATAGLKLEAIMASVKSGL